MDFRLEDSLGFILSKVNTKLKNEFFQRLREYDMTPEQWAILCCLWEKDGISPKEIAQMTCKDKPTTGRIVDKLIKKGFVVRTLHPTDKRAFQVFLTKEGIALHEQLVPIANQLLEKATNGIRANEVIGLKKLLNRLYENIL